MITLIILICAGSIAVGKTLLCFDAVLKVMHEHFEKEWQAKGCPSGFFWVPRGSCWLASWRSRQKLIAEITLEHPKWIVGCEVAVKARRRFLIWYGVACLIIIIGMIQMAVQLPPTK